MVIVSESSLWLKGSWAISILHVSVHALNIDKYCFTAAATSIASHSTAVCKMLLTVLIQRWLSATEYFNSKHKSSFHTVDNKVDLC